MGASNSASASGCLCRDVNLEDERGDSEAASGCRHHALVGSPQETRPMSTFTTRDGVEIYYKDWGTGQPVVFSHGWPLSADDWDAQMMFFLKHGYRVIAHDRRG